MALFKKKPPRSSSANISPWKTCCFNVCSLNTAARLIACIQIVIAIAFLIANLYGYTGRHENRTIEDALLIVVIIQTCVALVCSALIFLALQFRLGWLLIFEAVYLLLTVLGYLCGSILFESYVIRDALRYVLGRTECVATEREGFLCRSLHPSEWPRFDWWNLGLAATYLTMSVVSIWFFAIILKTYFYLKRKVDDERRRREKAVETLGVLESSGPGGSGGGGGLVAACTGGGSGSSRGGGGSGAGGPMQQSRSTLTTSLTTTTYEQRDPDLLLRY